MAEEVLWEAPRWCAHNGESERAVLFRPGHNGSHGCHGVDVEWLLRGACGAVHFVWSTGWVPGQPTALARYASLDYHSLRPMYEDQRARQCYYLDGQPCFYGSSQDLSSADASSILEMFLRSGEPVVWKALETLYEQLAEEARQADQWARSS